MTRYDLWFYLSDGVAHWAESLLFLFTPSCSSPVVRQTLVCCFMFSFLALYPGSSPFLPLFAWVCSVLCIGGCHFLPLSVFFFSFGLPVLFVAFCRYCPLPFFPFLHEVLGRFLPWFGVSPFRVSLPSSFVSPHLVHLGFVLPLLIPAFSFCLFFVSLVRPLVVLVSPLDLSLACSFLVPRSSYLFLSAWCSLYLRAQSYPEGPLSGASRRC